MGNEINERLKKLIKKEKLTQKKFCEIIGISDGTLNTTFKRNSNPGSEILIKILEKFPNYSINWLLSGKGEMEISKDSVTEKTIEINDYREKYYKTLEEKDKLRDEIDELKSEIESLKKGKREKEKIQVSATP
jgi:transcriptional regulator with XRE-family HTH domain